MAFSSTRTALPALGLVMLSFTALAQTTPAPATPEAPTATPAPAATSVVPSAGVLLSPKLGPSNYKDYLLKRYADDKEARAVVHMFGRKQLGGGLWLGGGAAFNAFLATQTGTTTTSSGGSRTLTISPVGYVVFIGLPAILGINKLTRFSKGSLFNVLTDYEKTHTFPRFVSARVHAGDYK